METMKICLGIAGMAISYLLLFPPLVFGHCDTLEGPVIADAGAARARGDIAPILKWVPAADEPEIREAFKKALAVRANGPEAREPADMYFFETLVRVHRASEGAPCTGIKAGATEEETLVLADKALATGKVDDLVKMVVGKIEKGIRGRFKETLERKKLAEENAERGREYVRSYVDFIRYGERIYNDADNPPSHGHAAEEAAAHGH